MGRKKTEFENSLQQNMTSYRSTLSELIGIAIARFEWLNVPETVNIRYLETSLLTNGLCVFFKDDVLGYIALPCMNNGVLNIYNEPLERIAYANNGYQKHLNETNSVLIYDNTTRTSMLPYLEYQSKRLMNIDRTIDTNVNVQKTPYLLSCTENERLTMLNMYKELEGNAPIIKGTDNLNADALKVFNTNAPYVADKLLILKDKIWGNTLANLGVDNMEVEKKERMLTNEVTALQGKTLASRWSYLSERERACEHINKMFGLNMEVRYRE